MGKVARSLDRYIALLGYIGAAMGVVSVIIIAFLTTLSVILRYFFNRPIPFADEYSSYLFMLIIYMGLAYAGRTEAHINVDAVIKRLSRRARAALGMATSLASLVVVGVYFWYAFKLFITSIVEKRVSETAMNTPLWIPQIFLWVGLMFFGFEIVARIVKKWAEFQNGSRRDAY